MTEPVNSGISLVEEIENTDSGSITMWSLGQSGFVLKHHGIVFYVDPCLSTPPGRTRMVRAPLEPAHIVNADLILCTHAHQGHMDPSLPRILEASPRARVVIPKSAAEHAHGLGISYHRMTTTDSDLRVEYFKNGLYGRVYSVPSAHPELDWTPLGGYPHLGYLIRFGTQTIYHAGDCRWYEGIVERLIPYNVSVALLPNNGNGNFGIEEAGRLAEAIRAPWLIPMHYATFKEQAADVNRFVDHMLGFVPSVGFKVFQAGEKWTIP